jgi:hypothetical protein
MIVTEGSEKINKVKNFSALFGRKEDSDRKNHSCSSGRAGVVLRKKI